MAACLFTDIASTSYELESLHHITLRIR